MNKVYLLILLYIVVLAMLFTAGWTFGWSFGVKYIQDNICNNYKALTDLHTYKCMTEWNDTFIQNLSLSKT